MSDNDKKVPQKQIKIIVPKPESRQDSVWGIVQKSEPDFAIHVRNSAPAPKRNSGEDSE